MYKQDNNPFTKLDNFTNPKRAVTNYDAQDFNGFGLGDVLNKTADGEEVIEDKTLEDKTGTNNAGKVDKDNASDKMNADVLKTAENHNAAKERLEETKKIKSRRQDQREDRKRDRQALRNLNRGDRKNALNEDEKKMKEMLEDKVKRNRLDRKSNRKYSSAEVEENYHANVKKEAAQAKKEEEDRLQREYEQRIKDDPYFMNQDIGPNLGNKGPGMYKQNDMDNKEISYGVKHLRSKGGAFPMVAPNTNVDEMGNPMPQPNRAGRGPESNQLSNNPNIQQPMNKVADSTFKRNENFGEIASSAGTPHAPGTMMPEHKTGYTPAYGQPAKALVDPPKRANIPADLRAKMNALKSNVETEKEKTKDIYKNLPGQDDSMESVEEGSVKVSKELTDSQKDYIRNKGMNPGMYDQDGPASFDGLVRKLESEGKSKEAATKIAGKVANMKLKGAGSGPTAAQKARSKGPGMHGDHAHTKITKGNVKAAEKDDAAHMDYLKRDVKDIQKSHMSQAKKDAWETADEKHISKLAGDLKYDNYTKRKYDNTGSALSFKMQAPYKQVKYSHSFGDSPLDKD